MDALGRPGAILGQPNAAVAHPRVSPDGRLVAATVGAGAGADIWIFDSARGTERRLTFEEGRNAFPSWTPDGRHVIYYCGTSVCARRADGSGARVELVDNTAPRGVPVVSPDGRLLVFTRETRAVQDLWVVELGPEGVAVPPAAAPRPLITAARAQANPHISPDGRFIAYDSSESGTLAVYVSEFPSGEGKWAVSRGYGVAPRWGRGGDQLYFVDALRRIAGVEVTLATTFEPGPVVTHVPAGMVGPGYDVWPDGQQFIVSRAPVEQNRPGSLLIVQNWTGR